VRTVVVERIVVERERAEAGGDAVGALSAGDALEVEYGGTWYPATVERVLADGRVEIAYDGYGKEWNEAVGPTRIRRRAPQTPPGQAVSSPQSLAKGTAVLIEWHGQWYPGEVRAVTPDGHVEIAYDGYDDAWNETVELDRLRLTGS
jgi:hypothetical protein